MNLTQIKDEVARLFDFKDYADYHRNLMEKNVYAIIATVKISDQITTAYSIACQEQLRRDCAELFIYRSHKQAILETPLIK